MRFCLAEEIGIHIQSKPVDNTSSRYSLKRVTTSTSLHATADCRSSVHSAMTLTTIGGANDQLTIAARQ